MADLFGHFLYVVLLIGQIMISRKRRWGWFFATAAMVGFSILGFWIGMYSIAFWSLGFFFVNLQGFIRWKT